MPISCDLGTMFIVKGELDDLNDGDASFLVERNVFAEVRDTVEDPETVLKDNGYSYVKHKDHFYVVGEDVFKVRQIESLFKKSGSQSYFSEVRRPMKKGLLNTAEDKMSIAIMQEIVRRLIGKPAHEREVCCFCAPGDPVNSDNSVLFHKSIMTSFISSLGFTAECVNEALALIYSENPTADDPKDPSGVAKFSGIGMSFGSGMINVCCSWKQLPLFSYSVENAGDWIDEQAARIAGCDVSAMTQYKEKYFDFNRSDSSDMKHMALEVYYKSMIENTMKHFSDRFSKLDDKIETPLEIVAGGGTASVPGFVDKFSEVLNTMELPFKIKGVRLAKAPLFAVCNGLLSKAISVENKIKAKQ